MAFRFAVGLESFPIYFIKISTYFLPMFFLKKEDYSAIQLLFVSNDFYALFPLSWLLRYNSFSLYFQGCEIVMCYISVLKLTLLLLKTHYQTYRNL